MASLSYNDKKYPLIEKIVIGRQKSCDIALLDQGASREHCKVYRDNKQRIWAEDLGSANGTKINGDKIHAPYKLKDGDTITCSKSTVIVNFDEADKDQNRTSNDLFNPEALVDKLIGGHRIQSVIGSTNIVTVYIARQLSLDRDVVLKVVHPNFADADSPLAKEIAEQTKSAARINHQSIAQVHECGTEHNFIWSSMELVEGEMLFDLLDREGQLAPDIALMVAEKIADGLNSAHEVGIVHRALNPRNIMISNDGRVKVVDLVLEQFLRHYLEQKNIPTPEDHADYLAPELLRGKKGDAKSDIYSLGCITFQMLSGQPPYVFDSADKTANAHIKDPIPDITDFCPDLPTSISELVSTMLHKNPEWRHQSMGDLRDDLSKLRQAIPANIGQQKARKADRPSPSQRVAAASGRGNGVGIFVNVLILAAIGLFVWFLLNNLDKDDLVGDYTPPDRPKTTNDDPNNITLDTNLDKMKNQAQQNQQVRQTQENNKALDELYQRTKTKVDQAIAASEWDSAEYTLQRAKPQFENHKASAAKLQSLVNQVQLDGRTWYNQELNKINSGTSINELRQQCIQLSNLRSKVLRESRADVEARYQQSITGMQRFLSKAKQEAIGQIESGNLKALQDNSNRLAAAFKDTVIEPMHAHHAALVKEAARIKFLGDWASTRQQLLQANTADDILSAGAALLLSGNADDGTRLLLKSGIFTNTTLQKRRDALLRSQAAVLEFDDSSDLQQLKLVIGQPGLGDGFLSGMASELYEFQTRSLLGDKQWDVACQLEFPKGLGSKSEMILQFGSGDSFPVVLRIDSKNVTARIEGINEERETPLSIKPRQTLNLRVIYNDGNANVFVNNQLISELATSLPRQTRLSFTSTDSEWKLLKLQVIGSN